MSKLAQLRELRNTKAFEARELNNKFPADQRMPEADAKRLDEILASIEQIDEDIGRETRLAQLANEQTDNLLQRVRNDATRDPAKHSETAKALRARCTALFQQAYADGKLGSFGNLYVMINLSP